MTSLTKEQADEAIQKFSKIAEMIFMMSGDHDPIAVFLSEEGTGIVSAAPIMKDAEDAIAAGKVAEGYSIKSQMAESFRKIAEEKKAFGVVTVTEAWMSKASQADLKVMNGDQPGMGGVVGPLPRFDPNRTEALLMTYEFKMADGSRYEGMVSRTITRVGEKASLGKPELFAGAGEGRLTKLLK